MSNVVLEYLETLKEYSKLADKLDDLWLRMTPEQEDLTNKLWEKEKQIAKESNQESKAPPNAET